MLCEICSGGSFGSEVYCWEPVLEYACATACSSCMRGVPGQLHSSRIRQLVSPSDLVVLLLVGAIGGQRLAAALCIHSF